MDDFGAVITDKPSAPSGPAPTASTGTLASASNNHALNNASYTTIVVTSSAAFQPATAANQTLQINVGTVANPNIDNVNFPACRLRAQRSPSPVHRVRAVNRPMS